MLEMGTENGEKLANAVSMGRKYPDDPKTEIFEASASGNNILLREVLQEMDSSEIASALETKMKTCLVYDEFGIFQVTPLILAVKNGNVDCVEVLLNYKADIEGRGDYDDYHDDDEWNLPGRYDGSTPLFVAAAYGHLDILKCLVENGADVNAATHDKSTPLMIASRYGHVNVVTFLIEHGANMDLKHKTGKTALHYVVYHNNDCCDVLSCFIKNGADVNATTNDNSTPLMIASKKGLVNVVTFLIEHGANVELQDNNGETALHYAVDSCDVLSFLIRNGADVNSRTYYKYTPLIIASRKGLVNVVTFLIEHGAKLDLQDKEGRTALHHAVEFDRGGDSCDVLSCLIRNGADVNARTNDNSTPLMIASKKGHLNEVNFLVEHGANMGLQDKNGERALHYAVGSCDILGCLIRNGANVNTCAHDNSTPLMKASLKGHMNAVILLVECGANMDQQDQNGDTALHYAVHAFGFNSSKVTLKLLSLGASQLYNNKGLTPLLAASNKCVISVVEDLITRPECTKEQRIDALELLGASLATENIYVNSLEHVRKGFEYMKRGMEERFADPLHPLLKQSMEPVEAYQNRKESQSIEELARIEHNRFAIIMESLIIRERILGTNNVELLGPIRMVAFYNGTVRTELNRHAMKIEQRCNQPRICDLFIPGGKPHRIFKGGEP